MQRNNNFEIPPGYTNEQFQEQIISVRTTRAGLVRNGLKRCPFTLKLLSVDCCKFDRGLTPPN